MGYELQTFFIIYAFNIGAKKNRQELHKVMFIVDAI